MKTSISTPSLREIIWVQILQKKHIFIPLKLFTRIYIHSSSWILAKVVISNITLSTCKCSIRLSSQSSLVKPSEKLEISNNICQCPSHVGGFTSFIHSFIYGCVGSLLLPVGFLQLQRAVATLRCGAWASHCGGFSFWSTGSRHAGFSSCSKWAQQLWRTGLVAPRHVRSSRTRDQTRVHCIGKQILNHCATREVPRGIYFLNNWEIKMCNSPLYLLSRFQIFTSFQ